MINFYRTQVRSLPGITKSCSADLIDVTLSDVEARSNVVNVVPGIEVRIEGCVDHSWHSVAVL